MVQCLEGQRRWHPWFWRRLARAPEAVATRSVGRPLSGSAELPRTARRVLRRHRSRAGALPRVHAYHASVRAEAMATRQRGGLVEEAQADAALEGLGRVLRCATVVGVRSRVLHRGLGLVGKAWLGRRPRGAGPRTSEQGEGQRTRTLLLFVEYLSSFTPQRTGGRGLDEHAARCRPTPQRRKSVLAQHGRVTQRRSTSHEIEQSGADALRSGSHARPPRSKGSLGVLKSSCRGAVRLGVG